MSDFHHFSTKLACDVGISTAVIYANISWWIKKNKEKNNLQHFNDGKWWTFNSVRKFSLQFPYMSERTIKNCLKKLTDDKYLVKGNFNVKSYDNTNWYALGIKGIEFEKTIGQQLPNGQHKDNKTIGQQLPNPQGNNCPIDSTQFAQPIPDINNSDINTDVFDESPRVFPDEIQSAKNFLKTEKKIQMDRLKMKYNLSPENLNDKINEFIDKKSDWGETGWKDQNEMAKNFEMWLKYNHKVIINPFKTMTEKEFHAEVGKFEKEFGKKMLTDFYRYWNQPTETGEMRFQEKNAWNTENQLKIWKSRNNGK